MRGLLLYATAVVVAVVTALFAWAWADARIGFLTLGAALVAFILWAARRMPESRRPHLAFRVLLFVAALGFVSLVGTILLLPTHNHHTCSVGSICEGPDTYNGGKIILVLLEALVILTSSFAAGTLWWERKWSNDLLAERP
jgi:hypothetical protein